MWYIVGAVVLGVVFFLLYARGTSFRREAEARREDANRFLKEKVCIEEQNDALRDEVRSLREEVVHLKQAIGPEFSFGDAERFFTSNIVPAEIAPHVFLEVLHRLGFRSTVADGAKSRIDLLDSAIETEKASLDENEVAIRSLLDRIEGLKKENQDLREIIAHRERESQEVSRIAELFAGSKIEDESE